MIEAQREIRQFIHEYPNSRSTLVTNTRMQKKGAEYLDYAIGTPIDISQDRYEELVDQANSYIRICQNLAEQYSSNSFFRRMADALVLQHEDKVIQQIVKTSPLHTLTGARYGTDAMIDTDGKFVSTEVNIGPAGGISEGIRAEEHLGDEFPINPNDHIQAIVDSLDAYYRSFSLARNTEPKPIEKRNIFIVENDEWTPGNFILATMLSSKGLNVRVRPRESFRYDKDSNTLKSIEGEIEITADQLILYFHIQNDYKKDDSQESGEILNAVLNGAVPLETSTLPLIVLASKSIAGMISQAAKNPSGTLAKRLGLNPKDLEKIANMFPNTEYWRNKYFQIMEEAGYSRFEIIEYFRDKGAIVKSSRTKLFAGMGVYGTTNKKGRKNYEDLQINIEEEMIQRFNKGKINIQTIMQRFSGDKFIIDLYNFSGINEGRLNNELSDQLIFANKFRALLNSIRFDDASFPDIINNITEMIRENFGINLSRENLINYLASYNVLPYVLQDKIIPSSPDEIRVCGVIKDGQSTALISTLQRGTEGSPRNLRIIKPQL